MDFDQILGFLGTEKARLDRVIRSLEEFEAIRSSTAAPGRRGRKSMNEEERREVSARMKKYWAKHRNPH